MLLLLLSSFVLRFLFYFFFFFQAEDGIRDKLVTGVQTYALPIWVRRDRRSRAVAHPSPAATSWCRTPSRKCDFLSTGGEQDEAVTGQGFHRLPIEIPQRLLRFRNESQRLRAAVPERAFVPGLLAKRLVSPPARGTTCRERTDAAARNAGQADGRPEIHERLCGGRREAMSRAFLHAAHVRVDGEDGTTQRKVPDRRSRVRPDAPQLGEAVRPTPRRDPLRGPVQVQAAPVVAEPLPRTKPIRRRSGPER